MGTQTVPSFSTETTTLPPWLTFPAANIAWQANALAGKPVEAYGGAFTQGLTPEQLQAGGLIQGNLGAQQPLYQQAAGAVQGLLGQDAKTIAGGMGGIGQYYNPYEQDVVGAVRAEGEKSLADALNQTRNASIGAGAYGGSRHGVQEGVATAENARNMDQLIAQLRQQGFSNAQNMLGQDVSTQNAWEANKANAANTLASIAKDTGAATGEDINRLFQYGEASRGVGQQDLDARYKEWLRQQGAPYERLASLSGTLGGLPHDTTTTGWNISQKEVGSSSPLMGIAGGLMSGLSMIPGIGQGISSLGGIASGLASRRGLLG